MSFIDTHAHLYSEQFDEDRNDMVARAFAAGVSRIYLPNVDSKSINGMLDLELNFPNQLFPMMGLHPCSVQPETWKTELDVVASWLGKRHFCAVGEIGMDLYWDISTKSIQEEAFIIQCGWAVDYDIPIIIHSRASINELIGIVTRIKSEKLRGIFHCFSGTKEQAEAITDLGFLLGIGGPVTYKKSTLPEVLAAIPLESIVLETDAPYLPPTPHRGKRNESSYIPLIASKLAEIKGVSISEVGSITTDNALALFGE